VLWRQDRDSKLKRHSSFCWDGQQPCEQGSTLCML